MNEDLSNLFEKFNINKDSISPEMINNIMGMINNSNNTYNNNDNDNSNNSTNNYSDNNSQNSSDNNSNFPPDIDIDTLLKMKKIIDKMNMKNDDPRSTLLNSLRPYLKESRRNKLDQYIQLLNLSKIIDILPFIGGENNGHK